MPTESDEPEISISVTTDGSKKVWGRLFYEKS